MLIVLDRLVALLPGSMTNAAATELARECVARVLVPEFKNRLTTNELKLKALLHQHINIISQSNKRVIRIRSVTPADRSPYSTMSTLEDLEDLEREEKEDKKEDGDKDKKRDQNSDAEMKDAEPTEKEEDPIDEEIYSLSTQDILTRKRLLENDSRIMKSEFQRLSHEKATMGEKIKDNLDKIENNRYGAVERQKALYLANICQTITVPGWKRCRTPRA